MTRLSIIIFASSALASVQKFKFISDNLWNEYKRTLESDLINHAILKECFYGTETLGFYQSKHDFNVFEAFEGKDARKAIEGYLKQGKNMESYEIRRIVTACAVGAAGELIGWEEKVLSISECAKKPLQTRVGNLLKEQHKLWIDDPSKLARLHANKPLVGYVNDNPNTNKRLSLFIQVLLIFGYINVDDHQETANFIKVLAGSEFFKNYLDKDHIILPTIDRVITMMLHDPSLSPYRKDEFSTLPGFRVQKYMLSELDEIVIDYMDKALSIKFCPSLLFKKTVS